MASGDAPRWKRGRTARPVARTARSFAVASALAVAAACGGAPSAFEIHGTTVVVRSGAEFTRQADFPSRVEKTVGVALTYWGGTWDDLAGKTISFLGTAGVPCPGKPAAIGCYDGDIRVSTQDVGAEVPCVEETALVHEIGHAVIGDRAHDDPRWMDFEALVPELAGLPAYGPHADGTCRIAVDVWRHPPGT